MRPDPIRALANALDTQRTGMVVVFYPDLGLREAIVDEVASVAGPSVPMHRATTAEEARAHPRDLVLLVPSNEVDAVLDLDAMRERFLDPARDFPVVLFLMRDGDGALALAKDAPALASWVRGSTPDPEALAEIDPAAERAQFLATTGSDVEAWLERWRAGSLPGSGENLSLAYWALSLERAR